MLAKGRKKKKECSKGGKAKWGKLEARLFVRTNERVKPGERGGGRRLLMPSLLLLLEAVKRTWLLISKWHSWSACYLPLHATSCDYMALAADR